MPFFIRKTNSEPKDKKRKVDFVLNFLISIIILFRNYLKLKMKKKNKNLLVNLQMVIIIKN